MPRNLSENRHFGVCAYLFKIEKFTKTSIAMCLISESTLTCENYFFWNSEEFGLKVILGQAPGWSDAIPL